jgi:hypothetical protein
MVEASIPVPSVRARGIAGMPGIKRMMRDTNPRTVICPRSAVFVREVEPCNAKGVMEKASSPAINVGGRGV